jgi:hypothetical protein
MGRGEDDMKVRNVKQALTLAFNPLQTFLLRAQITTAMTTGVVLLNNVMVFFTGKITRAHNLGSTMGDRVNGLTIF